MSYARFALAALIAAPAGAQILFAPPQPHALTHPVLAPLAGDLDGDGDADIVAQGAFPGPFQGTSLSVLRGTGGGGLLAPTTYPLSLSNVGEGRIVDVAALEGPTVLAADGLPDVLVGGVGFGNHIGFGWLAGHGDGSLSALNGFNLNAASVAEVAAHDTDGDGDLDFVVLDGGVSIFVPAKVITGIATGTGGFGFTQSAPALASASWMDLADIDGDGRADVLCNSSFGGILSIFHGSGSAFAAPESVTVGGAPRELTCADLDGDGALDVLVANQLLDAVQVLMGQAGGPLGPPVGHPAGHLPVRLAAGDLDGDGATDALVSASGGDVVVLQGGGDGTLTRVATVSSPAGALGLALSDMDGDGDLDAVVARAGTPGAVDVVLNASFPLGSPFEDHGHALAGAKGYPIQLAEGSLVAGQPFGFHLVNAKASTPTTHVVGLAPLFAPYKGGTMVPSPDLLNLLVTDAAGEIHLAGPWPAGGSGLTLWLQFWIADPAGIKGRAASNAVSATIP